MSAPHKTPRSPAAERQAAYRRRMREAGYRQKTIWVRDLNDPQYRALLDKEIAAIAASEEDRAVMAWLDVARDWPHGDDDIPDYTPTDLDKQR